MTGAEVIAVLRELVAVGLDAPAALAALERIGDAGVTARHVTRHVTRDGGRDDLRAQSDAERARTYRQRKRLARDPDVVDEIESESPRHENVTDRHVTRDGERDAASPPEVLAPRLQPPHPLTKNPITPNLQETPYSPQRQAKPAVVLGSILDPFNAKRFAEHCAGKRRPLSAEQAEAVVAELKAVRDAGGNPVDAINLAIGRGWTSFRREWLADKPQGGGARASPPLRMDVAGVFDDLAAEMGLSDVRGRSEPGGTVGGGNAALVAQLSGPVR